LVTTATTTKETTTMATATPTVHNPTNFEPSDYEVLDYLDNRRPAYYGQSVEGYAFEVASWEADMLATLGANWRSKAGHCVHCGNGNVRWITAVHHQPTGETVVFGSDCTERLGFANKVAFKLAQIQSKAEAGHARLKVWNKRVAFLAANPVFAAAVEQAKNPIHARNTFAHDVIGKLNTYGDLSERQTAAVITSLAKDIAFAARKAVEATEVKGAAPSGKATVTGEVLSTKLVEGAYGTTRKMLVKLPTNAKVWTSVPKAAAGVQRGDTITVTATFEVSKDDASFAFGKRPQLVALVAASAAL